MTSVLFVCLGNICRSPAGEEILRQFAKQAKLNGVIVASCGMGDWHVGQQAFPAMQRAAEKRGFSLQGHAQQFKPPFLDQYDWILAADHEVYQDLLQFAKTEDHKKKIVLMTEHSTQYHRKEVPDPYFGNAQLFEHVIDILEDACRGWTMFLQKGHT